MIQVLLRKIPLPNGESAWIVSADRGAGVEVIATGATRAGTVEEAMAKLGFTIMDRFNLPPGQIANFNLAYDSVRNVAVLRTGLHELYRSVKNFEKELSPDAYVMLRPSINGHFALVANIFDWFSISMLNLMEGVSLLNTLACSDMQYEDLASTDDGMQHIRSNARKYTKSIPEANPLQLWRDKVAAHRSGIVPPHGKPSDSLHTKRISLMGAQVMEERGRYVAPGIIPVDSRSQDDPTELPKWSLTKTWEGLKVNRYEWLDDIHFFANVDGFRM